MSNQPEQTFEHAIEANKDRIYRICRIYAVSPIEPKDLFQEVVFQAWKSYPQFACRSSIGTWIYRIALNVCLRSKMRLDKENERKVQVESIQFLPNTEGEDPAQKEKYSALRECISTLTESNRTLIILYLEELGYKEIAEVMGLTENHVAVKMKRIRAQLLDCITNKLK
ncbi:MAG: sigma-70 family RNA polymerase sigma factor [Cyclobacteriaceae bacterium]